MPKLPALRRGQHAVVTGGSSGLGLALATTLARRGLDVTLLARDRDRLEQARDFILCAAPGTTTSAFGHNSGEGARPVDI